MNRFINKLVERHHQPETNVKPRTRLRFENQFNSGLTIQEEHIENVAEPNTKIIAKGSPQKSVKEVRSEQTPVSQSKKNAESNVQPTIEKNHLIEKTFSKEVHLFNNFVKPNPDREDKPSQYPSSIMDSLLNKDYLKSPLENSSVDKDTSKVVNTLQPKETTSINAFLEHFNKIKRQDNFSAMDLGLNHVENNKPLPTIKINIGKIDVRANVKQSKPTPKRPKKVIKPKLTLEDYLNKQNNTSK